MYLLYLDDSGSPGNVAEDYYVLGGVSVYERQAFWITKALDDLARQINPADPDGTEFHASEVFSRRRAPWSGMERTEVRDTIKNVLRVLGDSHASTTAFACAVHKASFPGQDPVRLAFEEVCRRFDLQLHRMYGTGQKERGLLILDRSSLETSLRTLAREFRSVGTQWGVVRNLADTPMFMESHASRIMQLADHVAYAVFRRYNAQDATYIDPILGRFDAVDGRMHGLVHRTARAPDYHCPACMSRRLTRQISEPDAR